MPASAGVVSRICQPQTRTQIRFFHSSLIQLLSVLGNKMPKHRIVFPFRFSNCKEAGSHLLQTQERGDIRIKTPSVEDRGLWLHHLTLPCSSTACLLSPSQELQGLCLSLSVIFAKPSGSPSSSWIQGIGHRDNSGMRYIVIELSDQEVRQQARMKPLICDVRWNKTD